MPDFAMPSDDETAREARARAHRPDASDAGVDATRPTARDTARASRDDARADGHADRSDRDGGRAEPEPDRADQDGDRVADDGARQRPARSRLLAIVRSRPVVLVAGILLGVLLATAATGIQERASAGSVEGLESLAEAYVGAVESGDLAAATAMLAPDADYADASVLDAAAVVRPATIDCAAPRVDRDRATIDCDVATPGAGEGPPMRMAFVRDGDWRLETGLAVASPVLAPLASIDGVGGAPLPADIVAGVDPVWLYPGEYDLAISTSPELVPRGTTIAVRGDGARWLGGVGPTDALFERMRDDAVSYLAACAETAAAGCPPVAPLAPGERLEGLADAADAFGAGERELVLGVLVRRVGGAPDQWGIDVVARFSDDLQTFETVTSTPST